MGSYGIGVSRVMAALAEANHDEHGLIWPIQVAPYHVHVLATGKDDAVFSTAAALTRNLNAADFKVLYDDRRKVSTACALAGRGVSALHIVGDGTANALLCQTAADATGLPVHAGPAEATALGNILVTVIRAMTAFFMSLTAG